MGSNPSTNRKGANWPVERISWEDAQEFIIRINRKTGQRYRLPSEAEWEFAVRAGSNTEWGHGNDETRLGNFAWYRDISFAKTQSVGEKFPNAFGLYDMNGNVWEWTQDCWHPNYDGAPTNGSAWTTDCSTYYRVFRGGSSTDNAVELRSAIRMSNNPKVRSDYSGFRIAKDL